MNWDSKLDALLTAADDSMAKVKERLYTRGDVTKDSLYDSPTVRRGAAYGDLSTIKPASLYTPAACAAQVSSEDMVNLSSQLLAQAKMITSLHQAIGRLERDRDLHIQRIQSLEDEVRRHGASRGPDTSESLLERKMEGLRQELSSELRHLEDRVRDSTTRVSSPSLRSAASVLQEVNETKKLIWKEYESLRRDTDYMHQRLRRQEDDVMRQISDGQELRRAQEKNAAALERILSGHQTQTQELERARADTQGVQRDLLLIRSSIRDLMENVRILEGKVHTNRAPSNRPERRRSGRRRELSRSESSSEDDLRSRISLADISSEETSYSFSAAAEISRGSREKSSTSRDGKSRSDRDLDDQDLSDLTDSAPELNFSDL
ncbi:myosin-2 heavy chain, non muscle-like isoform X1 [Hyla sarda]|uniref:myosin-2 heavy chain, non muscle-like isoform X1 n=2 Tax=Hyla sarda TaxID=327740 RepID=UPI0024C359C7|nr:myosin-2 heavy chain, non muscle-like isoform X1 [Hyla sarda]